MDQQLLDTVTKLTRAHRRMRWALTGAGLVAFFAWAWPARSDTFVPHTFVANRPARASEINANFQAMADGINANLRRIETLEGRDDFVPPGTVAFFAAGSCPAGWTEYAAANGRYVVAVTGAGTAGATVGGDAMDDREDASHTHSIAHDHAWARFDTASNHWQSYDAAGALGNINGFIRDFDNGNSGYYALLRNGGDPTVVLRTSGASAASSGEVSRSAIAPYIQLRACSKS